MYRKEIFIIYFIGFLDMFAISLILPLLLKRARELGATPSIAGLIGSLYGAMQFFSSPTIGSWSDVLGCRQVMIWCLLLCAVSYFLLTLAGSLFIFIISRVFSGSFKHSQSLCKTYLAQITPKSEHNTVMGHFNSISSMGLIIGPIIGSHVAAADGGFVQVACVTAVCFLSLFAIVALFLPEIPVAVREIDGKVEQRKTAESRDSGLRNIVKHFREINWTDLWDIMLVRLFMGVAVLVYRTNFELILEFRYAAPPIANGYLFSFSAGVSTVASFFTGRIAAFYNNDDRLLRHAQLLQFFALIALGLAPSLWYLPVCLAALSAANSLARVSSVKMTLDRGRRKDTGALVGLGDSILAMARMIAPTLGGVAQEFSEYGPCIVASAISLSAVAIWQISTTSRARTKRD